MSLYKKAVLFMCTIIISSCSAGVKTMYVPMTKDVENGNKMLLTYECGDLTIQPEAFFSDGFLLIHYLIPLFPYFNESETDSNLEVKVSMYSKSKPLKDLETHDIEVHTNKNIIPHYPYKILLTSSAASPESAWYYKSYHLFFDINRQETDEFTMLLSNDYNNCTSPVVNYIKNTKTHYFTPLL